MPRPGLNGWGKPVAWVSVTLVLIGTAVATVKQITQQEDGIAANAKQIEKNTVELKAFEPRLDRIENVQTRIETTQDHLEATLADIAGRMPN